MFLEESQVQRCADDDSRLAAVEYKLAFDPPDEPVVRLTFTPFDKVGQPFLKFIERIKHSITGESGTACGLEPAFAHDMRDCAVRRKIVIKRLSHYPAQTVGTPLSDADAATDRRGTQIDQETFTFKNTMSFAEGMDHALMGHSSEGPGKDDGIEGLVRVSEPFGRTRLKANSPSKPVRQGLSCLANKRRIRIDRVDARPQLGESLRKPTVPAANLENLKRVPIGHCLKRAYLIQFRINA